MSSIDTNDISEEMISTTYRTLLPKLLTAINLKEQTSNDLEMVYSLIVPCVHPENLYEEIFVTFNPLLLEHYKGVLSDIQSLSLNITSIENDHTNDDNDGFNLDYDNNFNNSKEKITHLVQDCVKLLKMLETCIDKITASQPSHIQHYHTLISCCLSILLSSYQLFSEESTKSHRGEWWTEILSNFFTYAYALHNAVLKLIEALQNSDGEEAKSFFSIVMDELVLVNNALCTLNDNATLPAWKLIYKMCSKQNLWGMVECYDILSNVSQQCINLINTFIDVEDEAQKTTSLRFLTFMTRLVVNICREVYTPSSPSLIPPPLISLVFLVFQTYHLRIDKATQAAYKQQVVVAIEALITHLTPIDSFVSAILQSDDDSFLGKLLSLLCVMQAKSENCHGVATNNNSNDNNDNDGEDKLMVAVMESINHCSGYVCASVLCGTSPDGSATTLYEHTLATLSLYVVTRTSVVPVESCMLHHLLTTNLPISPYLVCDLWCYVSRVVRAELCCQWFVMLLQLFKKCCENNSNNNNNNNNNTNNSYYNNDITSNNELVTYLIPPQPPTHLIFLLSRLFMFLPNNFQMELAKKNYEILSLVLDNNNDNQIINFIHNNNKDNFIKIIHITIACVSKNITNSCVNTINTEEYVQLVIHLKTLSNLISNTDLHQFISSQQEYSKSDLINNKELIKKLIHSLVPVLSITPLTSNREIDVLYIYVISILATVANGFPSSDNNSKNSNKITNTYNYNNHLNNNSYNSYNNKSYNSYNNNNNNANASNNTNIYDVMEAETIFKVLYLINNMMKKKNTSGSNNKINYGLMLCVGELLHSFGCVEDEILARGCVQVWRRMAKIVSNTSTPVSSEGLKVNKGMRRCVVRQELKRLCTMDGVSFGESNDECLAQDLKSFNQCFMNLREEEGQEDDFNEYEDEEDFFESLLQSFSSNNPPITCRDDKRSSMDRDHTLNNNEPIRDYNDEDEDTAVSDKKVDKMVSKVVLTMQSWLDEGVVLTGEHKSLLRSLINRL